MSRSSDGILRCGAELLVHRDTHSYQEILAGYSLCTTTSAAAGWAIDSLHHVLLAMPRGREDEARRFYGDVLGLAELPKPSELVGRGGCWFTCGDREIHLGVEDPFTPARKAHPALVVRGLA